MALEVVRRRIRLMSSLRIQLLLRVEPSVDLSQALGWDENGHIAPAVLLCPQGAQISAASAVSVLPSQRALTS